jgi:hypothetical protein
MAACVRTRQGLARAPVYMELRTSTLCALMPWERRTVNDAVQLARRLLASRGMPEKSRIHVLATEHPWDRRSRTHGWVPSPCTAAT